MLPHKWQDGNKLNGYRVAPDTLLTQLEDYINQIIKISPLISNLYAVRRFLTYSQEEEKESMDKFVPSERNDSLF